MCPKTSVDKGPLTEVCGRRQKLCGNKGLSTKIMSTEGMSIKDCRQKFVDHSLTMLAMAPGSRSIDNGAVATVHGRRPVDKAILTRSGDRRCRQKAALHNRWASVL